MKTTNKRRARSSQAPRKSLRCTPSIVPASRLPHSFLRLQFEHISYNTVSSKCFMWLMLCSEVFFVILFCCAADVPKGLIGKCTLNRTPACRLMIAKQKKSLQVGAVAAIAIRGGCLARRLGRRASFHLAGLEEERWRWWRRGGGGEGSGGAGGGRREDGESCSRHLR